MPANPSRGACRKDAVAKRKRLAPRRTRSSTRSASADRSTAGATGKDTRTTGYRARFLGGLTGRLPDSSKLLQGCGESPGRQGAEALAFEIRVASRGWIPHPSEHRWLLPPIAGAFGRPLRLAVGRKVPRRCRGCQQHPAGSGRRFEAWGQPRGVALSVFQPRRSHRFRHPESNGTARARCGRRG